MIMAPIVIAISSHYLAPTGWARNMYVCICNAIREVDFRAMARRCHGDAEAVYAALGKEPQCRMCLEEADHILMEEREFSRPGKIPFI